MLAASLGTPPPAWPDIQDTPWAIERWIQEGPPEQDQHVQHALDAVGPEHAGDVRQLPQQLVIHDGERRGTPRSRKLLDLVGKAR